MKLKREGEKRIERNRERERERERGILVHPLLDRAKLPYYIYGD
jgi:hypothetical protein